MDTGWAQLRDRVAQRLDELAPGQFLIVSYGDPGDSDGPYAQCAPEPSGFYCEVSSAANVPASSWPINELYLRREAWAPPDAETDNWWRMEASVAAASRQLVEGLYLGRCCPDADEVVLIVGTFPSPPGGRERVERARALPLAA